MNSISNCLDCLRQSVYGLYSYWQQASCVPTSRIPADLDLLSSSSSSAERVHQLFWENIERANSHWAPASEEEWDQFIHMTADRPECAQSLGYVLKNFKLKPGTAIDLGCGSGSDTLYLLKKGWKVIAIDNNPLALKILKERAQKECPEHFSHLTVIQSKMEEYTFPDKVQLINATQALPFCQPAKFRQVWEGLVHALESEGVFVGQFYECPPLGGPQNIMYVEEQQVDYLMKKDFFNSLQVTEDTTISTFGFRKNLDFSFENSQENKKDQ